MPSPTPVLDHVAVAVPRAAEAGSFLAARLGARPEGSGPGFGFRWWQWGMRDGARLELLEPEGPADGFLHRFLAQRGGPAVHHVTFKVPRLDEAVARARELGFDVVGESDVDPSWKEAFLHPKSAQGVVVQLAESHPELEPEGLPRHPFPPLPERAPEPAPLVGLRLAAAREERALRQWQTLLRGELTRESGRLVFRWPDSPLRIAVDLTDDAPVGPIGLEIAPGIERPDTRAVLGTPLLAS
jgi:methylmalonyl-CoA/ethylmalonyl-CoA epimerase